MSGEPTTPNGPEDGIDALAVLELLADRGATFPVRVAGYLDPQMWFNAHVTDAEPVDVIAWTGWVAHVARLIRAAAVVGTRSPASATTLTAITGLTEGQLLVSLAEQREHHDVAELLEEWLSQLHARGPDGRPLHEDPTGATAAVVHLADRAPRTRRTP